MDWKETVMRKEDCFIVQDEYISDFGLQQRLRAQAEITWDKAIREVVEWIENNSSTCAVEKHISRKKWLAQKKKWGI